MTHLKDHPGFSLEPTRHYLSNSEVIPGKPARAFLIYHGEELVGKIHNTAGYRETRTPGCRYVNSRTTVVKWFAELANKPGTHGYYDSRAQAIRSLLRWI